MRVPRLARRAEPSLWTRLDLSGVRVELQRLAAVVQGAARRARGQLLHLDVSQLDVELDVLLPVLTANASSLRELHLGYAGYVDSPVFPTVKDLVSAAPRLQVLTADRATCKWGEALRVLRAEPPYAPLRLRRGLEVRFTSGTGRFGGVGRLRPFAAALADATLQPELHRVAISCADLTQPALMGPLVDAALARPLRELRLQECSPPATAPLARLLTEGSLTVLQFYPKGEPRRPTFGAGVELVARALRVNTTLTTLVMDGTYFRGYPGVEDLLLGALVGHPSLRELQISGEDMDEEFDFDDSTEDFSALSAALAALVAADAPALHVLVCSWNSLRDSGLAPIVEALTVNRHLRELNLGWNGMSEAFARERLLPAVRANTTLRKLECEGHVWKHPAALEAEELVRRRWQHD